MFVPKHSACGWTDIEMKNHVNLSTKHIHDTTHTITEMPNCQALHQLEQSGYHMRRVVPTLISPAFVNFTPRARLM
jgi:hypothetical protein